MMKALIIANGEIPPKFRLRNLIKESDFIICADGGANLAKKLNIKPDIIIGDFDSVKKSTLKYFKDVKKIKSRDQNSTDLEKAIKYCIKHNIVEIDIIGASGIRTDHTIGNLGCFIKFKNQVKLRMIDSKGILFDFDKRIKLKCRKGEIISLIPINRCTGVTTRNLKYKLKNDILEIGIREGTHNIATDNFIEVSVKKGNLLIYRLYQD